MNGDDVYRKVRSALVAARRQAEEEKAAATAYYEMLDEALRMHESTGDIKPIIRRLNSQALSTQQVLSIIRNAGAGESK